jgi:hypothetical protein
MLRLGLGTPIEVEKLSDVALRTPIPAFPVPLNATLCGEPMTESLKSRVAVLLPIAVGTKVTETVQLAPAARFVPQVVDI